MSLHPVDTLSAVESHPLPSRQDDRAHILDAIRRALDEHDGLLHISWVRPYVTRSVQPQMIGAVYAGVVRGAEHAGWLPNRGPSGNAAKPARVWRVTKEIR